MRKFMMIVAIATFFFSGNVRVQAAATSMVTDSLGTKNVSEQALRGVVGNLLGAMAGNSSDKAGVKDSSSADCEGTKLGDGRLGTGRLGTGRVGNGVIGNFGKNNGNKGGLGAIIGSVIGGAVQSSKPIAERVVGTWGYTSSKCVLESDDVMKKMGGELMATPIENKLNTTLEKIGVRKGAFSFTFNSDGTFSSKTLSRTVNGKYVVDEANKKVTMTYMGGLVKTTMDVMMINQNLSLLYDADKILVFLSAISAKSNSTTMKTINKITESYEGMKVGLEFTK